MSNMYSITKNVIENRTYDLTDIIRKINNVWMQGELSDKEKDELIGLARENAELANSVDILSKLRDHEERLRAVEEHIANSKKEDTEGSTEEPEDDTYPEFVAGNWYKTGDKVSFEDDNYECIAPEGQPCVWSPKDHPAYWQQIA